ncbi:saccharopine dehydrogenase NADP-binding domain-containing protein [Nocardia implantans]|uniref:Saccharopine dehydrogenase NADP-binding domain-containing protein n=1 Tax=Nocardia implantans TaxID=3108168 RepID=A0ABU6B439_9NOCA|nr:MULTISPECIES: saccharopine dehydrogenase NADP-binding domain-containing protein [unclassified Nocardia]MBF6196142.1 saccharopine dehydrogenase NADP-binding domain-containing protein [Nocardia beijingensis]MEA3532481.1 saccharopine dehydrogenase NADP-binding domain-containing protein [Nocardia sp. CDC192]MEB3514486.1 saccharopine dehydrogenase NADP-binding domain-containing protein [Nocardia sp. CDC186]
MADTREYDLVLFGATGFVGKLTAEYLVGAAPESARMALAGRSLDKLTAVRESLGPKAAKWGLVVADSNDQTALDELAARTKVVVTTVGPYLRYGMPLVAACAKAGTHYADLTGEPLFIRDAIDAYHEQAAATGAKIVNSCGYDSIPSDLSVYQLYRRTVEDNTGELADTTLVASLKGGVSGGTIDSGRAMMEAIAADPAKGKVMSHPYSLSPDKSMDPDVGRQSDQALSRASAIDPSLDGWVSTFVMAAHNTKIVRRSNGLLGWVYGKNFRYREVMSAGKSRMAPLVAAGMAGGIVAGMTAGALLSRAAVGRKLLDRVLPKPGTGPSEQARKSGWFTMKTFAHTTSGAKYVATFSGSGDPGYQATAVLLGESGLCLAFDTDKQPELAGILTPAAAMGDALTERLRGAGMTITVDRA